MGISPDDQSGFVGDYAPEALLWESPGRRVHAARAPLSDRCEHAVKRVGPDPLAPSQNGTEARRLLDAAAVQHRCAEEAPEAWARVSESGALAGDAAFVVTDLLPRSAAELVRLRVRLRATSLASIVGGVVRGLQVLRDTCDWRGHGALTPRNVRIAGDDPPTWRGVLTDPAPTDLLPDDAARGRLNDQRALGRLIALLVTHREPSGAKLGGGDEGWTRLGRTGPAWRDVCEELLDTDEEIDLDSLASRVSALKRRSEAPKRQRRFGALVTIVLAVGLGALLVFGTGGDPTKGGSTRAPFEEEPFRAWCADAEMWVLYFERDAVNRRAELGADAHLAGELLPVIDEAISREIELDPRTLVRASPRSRLRLTEMVEPDERDKKLGGRTTEALDIIGRLRAAIASWPAYDGAPERAGVYARRGWRPQGAFLDRLSRRVLAPEWTDLATGMVSVPDEIDETFGPELVESMIHLSEASRLCDEIDGAWERTIGRAEAIRNAAAPSEDGDPPDPLLVTFQDLPARYTAFRGLGGEIDSVRELHDRVRTLDELSALLEAFLSDGWARVDRPYFESISEALSVFDPESPSRIEDFQRWLDEASAPGVTKLEPESDPRLAYGGADAFVPIPGEVLAMRDRFGSELFTELLGASDLVERSARSVGVARDLDEIPWQRLTQASVESGAEQLSAELSRTREEVASLGADLERTANAYLDELRASQGVSAHATPSIDDAWRSMRDDLLARYDDDGRFADLRRAEAPARERLIEVERRLVTSASFESAPREFDEAALAPVLAERLDAACALGVGLLTWDGGAFVPSDGFGEAISALADQESAWVGRIQDLLADHASIEQLLDEARLLDEAGDGGGTARGLALDWRQSEELGDERIRGALSPVLARVEHLESIESETSVDRLVAIATDNAQETGAALTAYLGIDQADSGWPGSIEQLGRERVAMLGMDARAESLGDERRSDEVGSRVHDVARARWTRFAGAASDLSEVDAAANARSSFGADLGDLAPSAAYNVLLREFVTGVDLSDDEETVRLRVERLRDEMRPLESSLNDAGARRFIDDVTEIARPPDDSRPVLEARMFGPGQQGWNASDIDGGETLVYTTNGGGGAITIEFIRIEPDSSNGLIQAAYVSKREVSLGVVRSMGGELGGWEGVAESWLALADAQQRAGEPGGQEWVGARVWSWDRTARALVPAESWLKRHPQMTFDSPAYAPGLADPGEPLSIDASQGRPGDSMPMNHVSARAAEALAGALSARLPTEQEWRGAVRRQAGGGRANRRDATFARQRDWVTQVEAKLQQDGAVSQFSYPDRGAFLPRVLSAGSDSNATALNTDDGVLWFTPVDAGGGGAFSDLLGNVAEFVSVGEGFGVVGASALSAPEVDPMTVYPLRRAQYKRGGYSDVGFRLALDVPDGVFRQTVNRRMEKLLARASCVFE